MKFVVDNFGLYLLVFYIFFMISGVDRSETDIQGDRVGAWNWRPKLASCPPFWLHFLTAVDLPDIHIVQCVGPKQTQPKLVSRAIGSCSLGPCSTRWMRWKTGWSLPLNSSSFRYVVKWNRFDMWPFCLQFWPLEFWCVTVMLSRTFACTLAENLSLRLITDSSTRRGYFMTCDPPVPEIVKLCYWPFKGTFTHCD